MLETLDDGSLHAVGIGGGLQTSVTPITATR